jgi:hypothetical protein
VASSGLDALRALLNLEPVDGESWFLVPEKTLAFAQEEKYAGMRPAVLRRWGTGPLAVVYPRTTRKNSNAPETPAHDHKDHYPRCCISKAGWVLPRYPRTVAKDAMGDPRCREQDPATIAAVKAGRT